MTEEKLAEGRSGQLSFFPESKPTRYAGPESTLATRKAGTGELVKTFQALTEIRQERVSLNDPEQLRDAIRDYLQFCTENEVFPSVEGLCCQCRFSRAWLYKFLSEHPDSASGQILENFRNLCIAVKVSGNERMLISDASLIFQLKNVNAGFADRVELIPPASSPLDNLDSEAARRRLVEAIPDDDE